MKWSNHIALTGAITYGITGDIFGAMISGTSAVIPDMIEGKDYRPGIHRMVSHWFVPYMALLLASVFYIAVLDMSSGGSSSLLFVIRPSGGSSLRSSAPHGGTILSLFLSPGTPLDPLLIIAFTCQYISIGALLHICEDGLCGKVPLLNPMKKEAGMRLFITGSGREYCLTALVVFLVIVFRYLKQNIL